MTELSAVISELIAKGWPRDYTDARPPCWYLLGGDWSRLEDPDYAPDITGQPAVLMVWPPANHFLRILVQPDGSIGITTVEVYDGQGPIADGTAGVIPMWPGLDRALLEARLHCINWEVQQLRGPRYD